MAHVRTLVVWNGRVLLVQHHDPREDVIFWMPPGGGSGDGETPEEAAHRESGALPGEELLGQRCRSEIHFARVDTLA